MGTNDFIVDNKLLFDLQVFRINSLFLESAKIYQIYVPIFSSRFSKTQTFNKLLHRLNFRYH
jgi:hypothetical protein